MTLTTYPYFQRQNVKKKKGVQIQPYCSHPNAMCIENMTFQRLSLSIVYSKYNIENELCYLFGTTSALTLLEIFNFLELYFKYFQFFINVFSNPSIIFQQDCVFCHLVMLLVQNIFTEYYLRYFCTFPQRIGNLLGS